MSPPFVKSILFSCFEAWLISSAHDMGISDNELSSILSKCTFINGIVATISGVVSNVLVSHFGTVKAPFVASAALLVLAAAAIRSTWNENFGQSSGIVAAAQGFDLESNAPLMGGEAKSTAKPSDSNKGALKAILAGQALATPAPTSADISSDASLLTLGITQTFYETAMYLFVFLWVPALEIVSRREGSLPFGIIFSAFMCCMSFGSLIYGFTSESGKESLVQRHSSLAIATCAIAALSLVTSAMSMSLSVRFWAFCAFEATVGMYFPIMGTLRGSLIPDEARASVSRQLPSRQINGLIRRSLQFSAMFRVPLNVLVTFCLLTGAEEHKDVVNLASVAMLLAASAGMYLGIRRKM